MEHLQDSQFKKTIVFFIFRFEDVDSKKKINIKSSKSLYMDTHFLFETIALY